MNNTVFNIKEVAEYLRTSESSIRNHVRDRKIPFFKVGSLIFFRKAIIDEWIVGQEKKNSAGWPGDEVQ